MTREFILDTLLPYKVNPGNCGFENGKCVYEASNGNKCAVGKHLLPEYLTSVDPVDCLIDEHGSENIFTKDAFDQQISKIVWLEMQFYHDKIAKGKLEGINGTVRSLEYFTKFSLKELYF